jgi:lysophospholipase L1-like esterase
MVGTATATDAKAMIMLNDSNTHSSADAAMHNNGFKGLYERGINGQHATFNASFSGRKASDVTSPAMAFPKMIAAILPYYTHVLIALGGNDAATDTASTIETNLNTQATYWRAQGKKVGYSTIPPRTTGTFLNDAGQTEATGFGSGGVVDMVNADIREARAVVSDFNIFDMREATESVTAVTKGRADGGVAFTDGTHLTQLGVVVVGNHMANWPILLQAV